MKTILLAVCGLSPQVITEALYALHQEGRIVNAINLITTRSGKEMINAHLLSPVDGRFNRYLHDYRIDPEQIDFQAGNIHTLIDENGREIDDIIEEEDNECVLKKCLDLTFTFTQEPTTAVYFLVSGGRKTMSSCLTLAAQLYGRPQDRIYHVLVSPEFESNRDFFYPPPVPTEIELRNSKGEPSIKSTKYAKINLVSMPFVSIRDKLSGKWLQMPQDSSSLILSLVRETKSQLVVNVPEKKVIYKKIELDLPPALFALYTFFVMRKTTCSLNIKGCRTCRRCFLSIEEIFPHQEEITSLYQRVSRNVLLLSEIANSCIDKVDKESFIQYKSKIKTKIKNTFGPYLLPKLEITSVGRRPDTKYGIALDKNRVKIIW